jgi:hypothetical protein
MCVRTLGKPIKITSHDTPIELDQFHEGTAVCEVALSSRRTTLFEISFYMLNI